MAYDTPIYLRNQVIYQIYVRNHGHNGKFADVTRDLPRIHSMGVDIIYLMPIHPIGKRNKKGRLGCPYSIYDYKAVNPEYGTLQEFKDLIETAHSLGMKVMMDIVFHHTSHDSPLVKSNPEWFYRDDHGCPVSSISDWSDVVDLNFANRELRQYLIEVLRYWVEVGVDGFRCDVASLIPLDFWLEARQAIKAVKADTIWLAESVHTVFVEECRARGLTAHCDAELFMAFDIAYDYDIWQIWQSAVRGKVPVSRYLEMQRFQDCIYPAHSVKLRCVENHDQTRIMKFASTRQQALAWTALAAFSKGAFMIYAGQESGAIRTPSLFDTDRIDWGTYDLQPYLTSLIKLKKDVCQRQGNYYVFQYEPAVQAIWQTSNQSLYGIFNVSATTQLLKVLVEDGQYTDLLTGRALTVSNQLVMPPESACIFRCQHLHAPKHFFSELIDYPYDKTNYQ
ncbi:MAG: alpha-amylase [Anaerolineae bacterium]|nr:alpha-amylase [Anaerolineae bacterium]